MADAFGNTHLELRRSLGRAGHTDWTGTGVEIRDETQEANGIKQCERRQLKIQTGEGGQGMERKEWEVGSGGQDGRV